VTAFLVIRASVTNQFIADPPMKVELLVTSNVQRIQIAYLTRAEEHDLGDLFDQDVGTYFALGGSPVLERAEAKLAGIGDVPQRPRRPHRRQHHPLRGHQRPAQPGPLRHGDRALPRGPGRPGGGRPPAGARRASAGELRSHNGTGHPSAGTGGRARLKDTGRSDATSAQNHGPTAPVAA
jgi:hypothetical protein